MKICAFLPVYNEENRIGYALNSLQWCDEIIVLDKGSVDATRTICADYGNAIVHTIINSVDLKIETNIFLDSCKSDWIIIFTASDIMHPRLAQEIRKVIEITDASVLSIPFKRMVMGIGSVRSPWDTDYNPIIFKRADIVINHNVVHGVIQSNGKTEKIVNCDEFPMYHLTHDTVEKLIERHVRYWEGEAKAKQINLCKSIVDVIRALFNIIFIRKTYLLGYDGIALIFSYLSYLMMSYVYKWNALSDRTLIYKEIRERINRNWSEYNAK